MSVTLADGVVLTVEVGFSYSGTPGLQPIGGLFANVTWTDVSAYVRDVQISRGRSSELDQFQAGSASIVLSNADRRFDPEYASGPYYGSLTPMRPLRVRAKYLSGTTTSIFTGFVDGWPQAYVNPSDSTVTLNCSDAFKVLNLINLTSYWETAIQAENLATTWWRMDDGPTFDTNYDTVRKIRNASWNATTTSASALVLDDPGTAATFANNRFVQFPFSILSLGDPPFYGSFVAGRKIGVEFWMSTTQTDSGGSGIMALGVSANIRIAIGMKMTGKVGTITVVKGNYPSFTVTPYVSTKQVNDGVPHHVAFVYDNGTSTGTLYVDGVATGASTPVPDNPFVDNFSSNLIGYPCTQSTNADYNFTNYFNGVIDEVLLYNNVTLPTAGQIAAHYKIGAGIFQENETTSARIARILDLAQWPSDARALSTGSSTVQGLQVNGRSVLGLLQDCEAAEQARLFIDGSGNVKFISRRDLYASAPYDTSQYTFGDSSGELGYSDISFSYDDQLIKNSVKVGKANGGTVLVTDPTSISQYWTRSDSLGGLNISTELIAADIATARLRFYKQPSVRIDSLTFSPRQNPAALYPACIGADIGTRISVNRRPQGVGSMISKGLFIEGIKHSIGPDRWNTTYLLSPVTDAYFILNSSTLGVLGTSRLGY